jgi:hypothetical protein
LVQDTEMTKILDDPATPIATHSSSVSGSVPSGDNVFDVLAQRASERSPAELWTGAVGGFVSAAFILSQHPRLHWLGAGFAAVAAYGVWGLADRALEGRRADGRAGVITDAVLSSLRFVAVPAGIVSAILAMGSFMAAAFAGWIH